MSLNLGAVTAFLSRPATRAHRRVGLFFVGLLAVSVGLLLPIARVPIGPLPAFLPMFFVAMFFCYTFIGVLLALQSAQLRHPVLVLLGLGYAGMAILSLFQLLRYPGLWEPGVSLAARPTEMPWLEAGTRFGFPLWVWLALRRPEGSDGTWVRITAFITVVLLGICMVLGFLGNKAYMGGLSDLVNWDALLPLQALLVAMVLFDLVRITRLQTRLHVWLLVALVSLMGELVLAWMGAGAGDYTFGWYGARLFSLLSAVILLGALLWDIHDVHRAMQAINEQLNTHALRDATTGLFQRRHLNDQLATALGPRQEHGMPPALLMIDVDEFKAYNDTYGHLSGDHCLASIGEALMRTIDPWQGVAARYGGEEMAILLVGRAAVHASEVAEAVRRAVEGLRMPQAPQVGRPWVTISVGWARGHRMETAEHLIETADRALYHAKRNGRNQVVDADSLLAPSAPPAIE